MKNLLNYSDSEICRLLQIDNITTHELKAIIKNSSDYCLTYKSVISWIDQCFNKPSDNEIKLCAINELLTGYGIESISHEAIYVNHYYGHICASYVNFGDSYINTVLLDHISGKYIIDSWGDYYENNLMKTKFNKLR